jgi:hypothetical protein
MVAEEGRAEASEITELLDAAIAGVPSYTN